MNKKKNLFAILGFIFSFLFSLVGLILSILGLKKSKETNSGKGLSIAGIIISCCEIVFILGAIVYYFNNPDYINNYVIGDNIPFMKESNDYSEYFIKSKSAQFYDYIGMGESNYIYLVIENDKLLLKSNEGVEEIDLDGDIPKYVVGWYLHCGSQYHEYYILTKNGSVYHGDYCHGFTGDKRQEEINKLRNPKKIEINYKAKELLLKSPIDIEGPTCLNANAFILTEDDEIREVFTGLKYNDYKSTADGFIRYHAFNYDDIYSGKYIAIYDDGTIRDLSFTSNFTMKISDNKITDNEGNNILFNYLLVLTDRSEGKWERKHYIIDQLGDMYLLDDYDFSNLSDDYEDIEFVTKLKRVNNKKIKNIRFIKYLDLRNMLEINYIDGTSKKYISTKKKHWKVEMYSANNSMKDTWKQENQKEVIVE